MTTITSLPQLQARIATGDAFEYLHFRGHRQRADGIVTASCFSQWYPWAGPNLLGFALMVVRDRLAD